MKYLFILLLLVGCGHTTEKEVVDNYIFVEVVCEDYGKIDPIRTLPVDFVNAKDREGNEVLGLRGEPYSNLSINSRRTIVYIVEQNKAIGYYSKCIADHNATQLNEEGQPE